MKKRNQPFCPKCGKQDNVETLSEYLKTWQCLSCGIRFDFSPLVSTTTQRRPVQATFSNSIILDPARKVSEFTHVLDPVAKLKVEALKDKFKITADEKTLNKLIDTNRLKNEFYLNISKKAAKGKHGQNLQGGIINK